MQGSDGAAGVLVTCRVFDRLQWSALAVYFWRGAVSPRIAPQPSRCQRWESKNATHRYVEATLETKRKALARLDAPGIKLKRFRASDDSMKSLQSLQLCKARQTAVRLPTQRTVVLGVVDLRMAESWA